MKANEPLLTLSELKLELNNIRLNICDDVWADKGVSIAWLDRLEREVIKLWKDKKEQEKALKTLVADIDGYLKLLDEVMKQPSSVERGKWVAKLSNALRMAKDRVRFGALHVDFRTGEERK